MMEFFQMFLSMVSGFLNLLFSFDVMGDISVGDIFVALFIARAAFSILIKGVSVEIDRFDVPEGRKIDISDIRVDAGTRPIGIETRGFASHQKYYGD